MPLQLFDIPLGQFDLIEFVDLVAQQLYPGGLLLILVAQLLDLLAQLATAAHQLANLVTQPMGTGIVIQQFALGVAL